MCLLTRTEVHEIIIEVVESTENTIWLLYIIIITTYRLSIVYSYLAFISNILSFPTIEMVLTLRNILYMEKYK